MGFGNIITANADDWYYWWRNSDVEPLYYKDYSGYSEFSTAISDWNNVDCLVDLSAGTGLQALVWIHKISNSRVEWCGQTIATNHTGTIFELVDVLLNDHYLDDYESNKKRSVMNHELGHVHGLDHAVGDHSISVIPYFSSSVKAQASPPLNLIE